MSKREQRIAIAEWQGYHFQKLQNDVVVGFGRWILPDGLVCCCAHAFHHNKEDAARCLPDYPNDLNAVHEVEAKLFDGILFRKYERELASRHPFGYWFATASERCEALLRTIGKWKDA